MTTLNQRGTDVASIPPLTHLEAMTRQAAELQRSLDLMRSLTTDDWSGRTDCPDWDVRLLYLHVLGACESGASLREFVHQARAANAFQRAHGGPQEAALSAIQVADRMDVTPAALVARFDTIAPRTIRARRRLPSLVRRVRIPVDGPVAETWTVGYLVDTIYLRDAWMHRIDVARATGTPLVLTAAHDGRIVADVVAEWARRHGRPFALVLDGPAGGTFTSGRDGEPLALDAVEFCRTLAGRAPGNGLLATIVPF